METEHVPIDSTALDWSGNVLTFISRCNVNILTMTMGWQEMGKIPNFTESERLKTPKTDCVQKVYKDKEFYQLGLQVC